MVDKNRGITWIRQNSKRLRAAYGIEATHRGQLTRCDGREFTAEEARKLHKALVLFLSFAHQFRCGSTHIEGSDRDGQLAWEIGGGGQT